MKLGIFLSPGDSLEKQKQTGQLERFINYYLKPYGHRFSKVIIFSYGDVNFNPRLPRGARVIPKPNYLPNYLYQLLLPFVQAQKIKSVDVFRVFQAPGGLPALLAKIFFNKPYVITYGYDYVYFLRRDGRWFLAALLSLVLPPVRFFAKRIVVTDPDNLSGGKTEYIPNGVDPNQFHPGRKRKPYLVLSVGRLEKQKRYDLLIKAVARAKPGKWVRLVVVGEGSQRSGLTRLAQKLKVNLALIDNLPHAQLVGWYQRAAVFALTSAYEGNPKTLIEALSCACPCLTTNFSGNPVIQGQSGLIATGVSRLAAGLDRLLTDRKLAVNLGKEGRQLVLNKYDIKELVSREIDLLLS